MKLILILIASIAFAQPAANRFTVLPKSDGTATGEVRFREIVGSEYGSLVPPSSMLSNRTWTLPNYDTSIIGVENRTYGQPFRIIGEVAGGTEASPTAPNPNDLLFEFVGMRRSGGGYVNAASMQMQYVGPGAQIVFSTTSSGGGYATRWTFDQDGHLLPSFAATQDIGSSVAPIGALYGKTADIWRSGEADTSWVRSQNFEIMDNAGGSLKWRWKGYVNAINKYVWLEDDAGAQYAVFRTLLGGNTNRTAQIKSSWLPMDDNTWSLGSNSLRWSGIFGNDFTATGTISGPFFNLITTGTPSAAYRVNGVDVIDASRNAAVNNLTVSGTCTGCGGSGGYPLGEVKLTDYGAVSNCSSPTTIRTALTNAIAALPLDAAGLRSGIVAIPAGCYGWDGANGSFVIDRAAGHGAIWIVGAGAGNEFAAVGAGTEIRAISAPASPTAMFEFRSTLGGGLRDINLNAAGLSNTRILKIRASRYGKVENLQGRRWTNGPGLEMTAEASDFAGACNWLFAGLQLGDVRDSDNAAGIYLGGYDPAGDRSSCSNLFVHGSAIFSKSGSTNYGLKLQYADNNTFQRFNVWASDCTAFPCESNATGSRNSSKYALLFEQNTSQPSFPKENWFSGTLVSGSGFQVGGRSGSAGNIINHTTDDCGGVQVAACFPTIRNLRGETNYGSWNLRAIKAFTNTYDASMTVDQAAGGISTGGRIDFARQERIKAYMQFNPSTGLEIGTATGACDLLATVGKNSDFANAGSLTQISVSGGVATASLASGTSCVTGDRVRVSGSTTAALNGEYTTTFISGTTVQWATGAPSATYNNSDLTLEIVPTHRWTITNNITPSADGSGAIGTSTLKPSIIYSRRYDTYTSSGTQSHLWTADSGSLNFSLSAYGGSGSTERAALFFDRYRGTASFPVAVETGDRLGVIAFRGMVTGGLTNGALVESYTSARSGNLLSADLRFSVFNFGTQSTALQLLSTGAASFASTIDATTINATGSPSYRVGGQTVIDNARNITAGSINPISASTYNIGSFGFSFANIYADTAFFVVTSGVTRFSASGGGINIFNSGGSTMFTANQFGSVTAAGSISASGGYVSSGNAGTTVNLICGSGQAVKNLNVIGGIVISASCGAP